MGRSYLGNGPCPHVTVHMTNPLN